MTYTLIRSRRRKRSLALHVTKEGELVVRAPQSTPRLFIDHFVRSKKAWITKQQNKHSSPRPALVSHFTPATLKQFIRAQVAKYASLLDLHPTKLCFKQVKSYWGNCSAKGVLSFNLQLRYAPPEAVTYVVVHELVHLRHRGHGKRFWALVKHTYPQANEMRRILRQISRGHQIA